MRVAAFVLFSEPEAEGRVVIEVADGVHVIVRVLCCDVEDLELAVANNVHHAHFGIE